nr:hypothetical protein [Tanacetum cinerariifolium]
VAELDPIPPILELIKEGFNESPATSDDDLDPGSWRPIFEPNDNDVDVIDDVNASYYKSVGDMIDGVSGGAESMEDVVKEIDEARGGSSSEKHFDMEPLEKLGPLDACCQTSIMYKTLNTSCFKTLAAKHIVCGELEL